MKYQPELLQMGQSHSPIHLPHSPNPKLTRSYDKSKFNPYCSPNLTSIWVRVRSTLVKQSSCVMIGVVLAQQLVLQRNF